MSIRAAPDSISWLTDSGRVCVRRLATVSLLNLVCLSLCNPLSAPQTFHLAGSPHNHANVFLLYYVTHYHLMSSCFAISHIITSCVPALLYLTLSPHVFLLCYVSRYHLMCSCFAMSHVITLMFCSGFLWLLET